MRSLPLASALVLAAFLLAAGMGASWVKYKDKSKPVRAALERRYAEMRDAYFARDSSAVLATRRPDTFAITPAGDTMRAGTTRAYIRASFEQVQATIALDWTLGVIDVQGDTAAAEVDQHWERRQLKGGAVRHVETRAHQRETWIRTGDVWSLWRVDQVQPGEWRVDGKRIDPSKPYDPDAPEYHPH